MKRPTEELVQDGPMTSARLSRVPMRRANLAAHGSSRKPRSSQLPRGRASTPDPAPLKLTPDGNSYARMSREQLIREIQRLKKDIHSGPLVERLRHEIQVHYDEY